ncbi:hypothetical protein QEU_0928 [Clostridioides difficile CD159]|nr:hypothetical protein QEU_0928 [Clostridioides difficile CD159]
MWYVNNWKGQNKRFKDMFYINYVVCKSKSNFFRRSLGVAFYINYVVCK